jgi:CRP-like cAMP-binding protein
LSIPDYLDKVRAMHAFSTSERFDAMDARDRDRLDALSKLDQYPAGSEISSSARPSEWLYLIMSGKVELRAMRQGQAPGEVVLAELGPGDLFGELEIFAQLSGVRHVASAETTLWAIGKNPLMQELRIHRTLAAGLLAVYSRSISEKLRAANEALARLPDLHDSGLSRPPPPKSVTNSVTDEAARPNGPLGRPAHLTSEEIGWLSMLGTVRSVAAGTTIVHEGQLGRSFFVVAHGVLEVQKNAGASDDPREAARMLAELSDGDLFGFMAFVDKKPRSASVVAKSACELIEIEGSAMEKALNVNFTVSFKFLGALCGVLGRTFRDTAQRVMLA